MRHWEGHTERPGSRRSRRPSGVVTASGMAGWQITLIALGAALLAAATTLVLDRTWAAAAPPRPEPDTRTRATNDTISKRPSAAAGKPNEPHRRTRAAPAGKVTSQRERLAECTPQACSRSTPHASSSGQTAQPAPGPVPAAMARPPETTTMTQQAPQPRPRRIDPKRCPPDA